jgi:hypothetical protein
MIDDSGLIIIYHLSKLFSLATRCKDTKEQEALVKLGAFVVQNVLVQ